MKYHDGFYGHGVMTLPGKRRGRMPGNGGQNEISGIGDSGAGSGA